MRASFDESGAIWVPFKPEISSCFYRFGRLRQSLHGSHEDSLCLIHETTQFVISWLWWEPKLHQRANRRSFEEKFSFQKEDQPFSHRQWNGNSLFPATGLTHWMFNRECWMTYYEVKPVRKPGHLGVSLTEKARRKDHGKQLGGRFEWRLSILLQWTLRERRSGNQHAVSKG